MRSLQTKSPPPASLRASPRVSAAAAGQAADGPAWSSIALAVLMLVAGGAAMSWQRGALDDERPGAGLPPGFLANVPITIGPWRGSDVPMDLRLRAATDTDDLLHRRYVHPQTGQSLALYIAYGTRARDLLPHRPEVCYPGAGWTQTAARALEFPLNAGPPLRCSVREFTRGGLDGTRLLVVSFYIVDGVESPDVDLLRTRLKGIDYMLQVQLVAPINYLSDKQAGLRSAQSLAAALVQELRAQLAAARPRPEDTGLSLHE